MKKGVEELLPEEAVQAGHEAFPDVQLIGIKLTDLGNAERLIARNRGQIRHCPPWRKWLVWDGRRWKLDETGEVNRLARKTVRAIYNEAERASSADAAQAIAKHAVNSEKAERLSAMVRLAAEEPGVPVMPDELDADPMLLNTMTGTINLETGEQQPHRRSDLITKLIPIAYDAQAKSDLWDRFLSDVTGGDAELASFLQRLAGYSATGLTTLKHFFFAYSECSDTGKSTFADALRAALGEYAMDADFETWLERRETGGNRGDLARLVGARLVISVEVKPRAKFDTKLVKAITGGDPIVCAAKYGAEFAYRPKFKILLAANDAPIIRDTDKPMFERCMRVPFDVKILKKDEAVKRRLSDVNDAGPAILAWIVQGALLWKRDGLSPPEAVKRSSAAYHSEMDTFAGFILECCILENVAFVTKKTFRETYDAWCKENAIRFPLSNKDVKTRLKEMNVDESSSGKSRLWVGIRLRDERDVDSTDRTDTFPENSSHEEEIEKFSGIASELSAASVGDGRAAGSDVCPEAVADWEGRV